jgi:hypothetical protein
MIVGDSSPPSPSTPNPNLARVSLELEKKLGGGEDGGEKKFVSERPPNHSSEL